MEIALLLFLQHIVSPQILFSNSIKKLPIKTQNNLFLTTLDCLSDSTVTQTYIESLSTKERYNFFLKNHNSISKHFGSNV